MNQTSAFTWHDFRRTMISDIIESEGLPPPAHGRPQLVRPDYQVRSAVAG